VYVIDNGFRPLENATVTLRETRTNFERTLTTDRTGTFAATLLPLGVYNITVRVEGYGQVQRNGVPVRVGETVDLDLEMVTTLEEVVVEVGRPTVDVGQSEQATRLPEAAVDGLPNNGRNYLDLTLLTPGVAIVQGPDGAVLSIAGQKGIHNNVAVDGADFNNPFFGEQRGGQRPAFTFNLDAVEEIVVVPQGANAEFGRSSGGFVNVITKSGTNTLAGSLHYYGKFDALSSVAEYTPEGGGATITRDPDFSQHQFGFTLGGPLQKDRVFFFTAYDQQRYRDTRQQDPSRWPAELRSFADNAYGGALANDYGPIDRTNDARAFLAKLDWRINNQHNFSLKYNHTWSEQVNGTFDVDAWGRSANAIEKDYSNAINGSLNSVIGTNMANEFRFQFSREDRPRPYDAPTFPNGRDFPDTAMDFGGAYRLGRPFFIPVEYYDTRFQVLNNLTISRGRHLFKLGAEWNRVESVQTFIGFANGRFIFSSTQGFLNYVQFGNQYVECSDGSSSLNATCPDGTSITGPVLLYLQQAGVPPLTVEEAGTQGIPQHELGVFVQDSWNASDRLTLNYGLRWEAQVQPKPITPADEVFYAPFIGQTRTFGGRTIAFPSDGEVPSDLTMFQPRFGLVYDVLGDESTVFRASAGIYHARIPGLVLASSRSTNGSRGQTLFRNSALTAILGPPPNYDELLESPAGGPFRPDVFVFDQDFRNPRTLSASAGIEHNVNQSGFVLSAEYVHARTDRLTRFTNGNDPLLRGDGSGLGPWSQFDLNDSFSNGVGQLTVVESTAESRYNGITFGIRNLDRTDVQFQANYTLSFDKSDDDNERDPFTLRYARITDLDREYNWSERDQRHRFNAWMVTKLAGDVFLNNRISYRSAQPASESCGPRPGNEFAPPAGARAVAPADRICADGSVLLRNTLRKDNAFFSWDLRLSRPFELPTGALEAIIEVFNLTNASNFLDPTSGGLLFNFDGTVQSGLGTPRQVQFGLRYRF
jgi:hypothetical protein